MTIVKNESSLPIAMKKITHAELIDLLGGTMKVAEEVELHPTAISHWKHRGIPRVHLRYFRLVRPDIFERHKLIDT